MIKSIIRCAKALWRASFTIYKHPAVFSCIVWILKIFLLLSSLYQPVFKSMWVNSTSLNIWNNSIKIQPQILFHIQRKFFKSREKRVLAEHDVVWKTVGLHLNIENLWFYIFSCREISVFVTRDPSLIFITGIAKSYSMITC